MLDSPAFNALKTAELLVHVKSGSQDAWREVYRRYRVFLSNAARRVTGSSAADAEDVLQSAFLSAWKDFGGFAYRGSGSFRAWLEQIVVHKNLSKLRTKIRRADLLKPHRMDTAWLQANGNTKAENPADSALHLDDERRLRECMDQHLNDVSREIILLKHQEGLTTPHIADVVELSVDQVRRRYKAAMKTIALELSRAGRDGE